jgi:hypothetical protein
VILSDNQVVCPVCRSSTVFGLLVVGQNRMCTRCVQTFGKHISSLELVTRLSRIEGKLNQLLESGLVELSTSEVIYDVEYNVKDDSTSPSD